MATQVDSRNRMQPSLYQSDEPAFPLDGRDPVTILMVDDQPSKLLSYEVILQDLGERLVKAHSGREALDYLLKGDVAVVLMDVSMPEIDGFELADMMRQHPRFQKTPIIFVSAVHLSEPDRIRGYQSGAVDYISVPVVPEVLRAKVSVFAELHRKKRALQVLNRDLEERVAQRSEQLRLLNEQLQQRVAELESIMQVLPVGVAVAHGRDCETVTGNTALGEMLGSGLRENPSEAALSMTFKLAQSGERLPPDELPLRQAAKAGLPTGMLELEVAHPEGSPHFLLASASPLFDETGNVRGAVGAFFDVTERKRMDDALRERAELLELATEAIMVRDKHGAVRFWGTGAVALDGCKREEVLGLDQKTVLGTRPADRKEIDESLAGEGRWEGNLKHRNHDGHEILVASRQAVQAGSGAVLEITRDITAQVIAEEALRRNERLAAMGKLAGIVAHEINNPLEAITNAFYLLRQHHSLDEEAKHYAQIAEQELARVSHITKQTLSFYRESQTAVSVSLSELLDDVLELQQRPLQIANITLERDYSSEGTVHGFPSELKQVFMNLVSNAIQAMPQGGRIRVRLGGTAGGGGGAGGGRVFISDRGRGTPPENAKLLLEPFFTTKSTKGTGLGLWISRGIVQKHEGTLRFRSVFGPTSAVTAFHVFVPTHAAMK